MRYGRTRRPRASLYRRRLFRVRGTDDLHLLDSPVPALLEKVTGLKVDRSGKHAMLAAAGIRSTQRLALGDVGGGIVAFTWPAELVRQAKYLYTSDRALRLLDAAADSNWKVDMRPHLAFWTSRPPERVYTNPAPEMGVRTYVQRWGGPDAAMIGGHPRDTIRSDLWPWLLERGYATPPDEELLEPFLGRLAKRNRDAHLRPGLCVTRRWGRAEVDELRRRDELASEIRSAVNRLLAAVDDASLPAR